MSSFRARCIGWPRGRDRAPTTLNIWPACGSSMCLISRITCGSPTARLTSRSAIRRSSMSGLSRPSRPNWRCTSGMCWNWATCTPPATGAFRSLLRVSGRPLRRMHLAALARSSGIGRRRCISMALCWSQPTSFSNSSAPGWIVGLISCSGTTSSTIVGSTFPSPIVTSLRCARRIARSGAGFLAASWISIPRKTCCAASNAKPR